MSRLCLSLVVCFLAGCGAASDEVVIEFWAIGREGEVVQELMPAFERQNPGVRVRVQQIPWKAAHEKLLTAFAGDAVPDVCQLGSTWIPEFAALHALENLDPWIARSAVVDSADYFTGIWRASVIDGHVYGVPWYVDTRLLFYREDLMAQAGYPEPPETWAGWLEAMRRIKAQADPGNYAILLPVNEWEQPVIFGLQMGSDLLRDGDRHGDFRGPAFREAFDFYLDFYEQGLAPRVSNVQVPNVVQEVGRGYIAMYITGPWNIGEFRRRLPDSLQDAWMTAPLPRPAPGRPGVSVGGGASLVLFEASEHKEAGWKLIEYLSHPEQQVAFHELIGNLPARKAAWEDPVLADNPYLDAFFEQLTHVRTLPRIPEWERIASKVLQYAEAAILGRMTRDQALAALDRDVDAILEKRRWLLAREEKNGP